MDSLKKSENELIFATRFGFELQNRCLNFARKYSDHVIFEEQNLWKNNM